MNAQAKLEVGSLVATWRGEDVVYDEPEGIVTMIDEDGSIWVKWMDMDYPMFDEPWQHTRSELVVIAMEDVK